jgi:TPR repeat protein
LPPGAQIPQQGWAPTEMVNPLKRNSSGEEIERLVARGRQLIVAGDIPNARLVLQQAAEAGDASAALALGTTYDPIELEKLPRFIDLATRPVATTVPLPPQAADPDSFPDIAMARIWYQKAKDLGSIEAVGRLQRLADRERQPR